MLEDAVVLAWSALAPTAVLDCPEVVLKPVKNPKQALYAPEVTADKDAYPNASFLFAVKGEAPTNAA